VRSGESLRLWKKKLFPLRESLILKDFNPCICHLLVPSEAKGYKTNRVQDSERFYGATVVAVLWLSFL